MANWFATEESIDLRAVRIIKEGVTAKYLVTNRSDIKIGTMNIRSTNECRWVVQVKEIRRGGYLIELLTMENVITETNNPMVKDVAGFNNMFKEIYNELVLDVNPRGELLAVRNPETIRSKWARVRQEMKGLESSQASVSNVIRLNDDIFDSDDNLFNVVKATEFFELFFIGFYGRVLPATHRTRRANKFKGNQLDWTYTFTYTDGNLPFMEIGMKGAVNQTFSKTWLEETYGKFEFLDYKNLKPEIHCNGQYKLNKQTGMIEEATYNNYETIDPNQLYSKNQYTIATYQ